MHTTGYGFVPLNLQQLCYMHKVTSVNIQAWVGEGTKRLWLCPSLMPAGLGGNYFSLGIWLMVDCCCLGQHSCIQAALIELGGLKKDLKEEEMNKVGWVMYWVILPEAGGRILVGYDQDIL